jgi:hypothetical protein
MKICYICSRYADPDVANRRRNLAEARALARWAEAQGYAVVTWWGSLDPVDPPCDSDEDARARALARSAALAGMVGRTKGALIMPTWYGVTSGMTEDARAHHDAWRWNHSKDPDVIAVSLDDLAPYLLPEPEPIRGWIKRAYARITEECLNDPPEPVPTVPRAAVQAAVDEIAEGVARIETNVCNGANATVGACGIAAYQDALGALRDHTGITPGEVPS